MIRDHKSNIIKKEFAELFKRNMTNISQTCNKVGIDRSTYYAWYREDPEFRQTCNDAIEFMKDAVESVLYKKVMTDHDTASTIFFCKTKMKDRGYVERQELTGADGQPVQVETSPITQRNQELIDKVTGG